MSTPMPDRFCSRCGGPIAGRACPRCRRRARQRALPLAALGVGVVAIGLLGMVNARSGSGGFLTPGSSALTNSGAGDLARPPLTAAHDAAPVLPQPPAVRHPHVSSPAPAARTRETMAPSMLLSQDPAAPPTAPSIASASARPDAPAAPVAPPVLAAPAPAPATDGGQLLASASPQPAAVPSVLNSGWTERPGKGENPELVIHNDSGRTATLLIHHEGRVSRWLIRDDDLHITLQPGTHQYELREEVYAHTGRPDQVGTLTLGKHRIYEATYFHRATSETREEHIGDE